MSRENVYKGQIESRGSMYPLDKLSNKDKRIINELLTNGRFSITTLAKRTGLSRDVVSYRLNSMIKNKLIPGFTLLLDINRLGLLKHMVYVKFQHIGKDEEKIIIEKLMEEKDIVWVAGTSGNWDMGLITLSKDVSHFNNTFNKIIEICGNSLKDYTLETEIYDSYMKLHCIKEGAYTNEPTHKYVKDGFAKEFEKTFPTKNPKIDQTDIKLINLLMQNSRSPIAEICHQLKLSAPAVENRIKRLIKEEIIYGFMTQVSLQMLGLQWSWIFLRTKNITAEREEQFKKYLEKHPYISWIVKTVGKWNFEVSVFARDAMHFRDVLSEIRKEFSDIIVDHESITVFTQYKYMHSIEL